MQFHQSINACYPEGFSQTYFPKGVDAIPLRISNTEGHTTLNLLIGMDILLSLILK